MRLQNRNEKRGAVENYIVRIYRRKACNPDDPDGVVGQVECVENADKFPFRGMSELVAILSEPASEAHDVPEVPVRRGRRFS